MSVDMSITVSHKGETENGKELSFGDKVEYCGHIPFGNISIRLADGSNDVANQACFKELR